MKRIFSAHPDSQGLVKKEFPVKIHIILMILSGKDDAITTRISKKSLLNAF